MEFKLDIPFEQLLRIIRQLGPAQRRKVQAALEQEAPAKSTTVDSLDELLLRGPVFSGEQIQRMTETRKAFEQWHKK